MTDKPADVGPMKRENRKSFFGRRARKSSQSEPTKDKPSESLKEVFDEEIMHMTKYKHLDMAGLLAMEHKAALELIQTIEAKNSAFYRRKLQVLGSVRKKGCDIEDIAADLARMAPQEPPKYQDEYIKLYEQNKMVNCIQYHEAFVYLQLMGYFVLPYTLDDHLNKETVGIADSLIVRPHDVIETAKRIAQERGHKNFIGVVKTGYQKVIKHQKSMHSKISISKPVYPTKMLPPSSPTATGPTNMWKNQAEA